MFTEQKTASKIICDTNTTLHIPAQSVITDEVFTSDLKNESSPRYRELELQFSSQVMSVHLVESVHR